MDETESKVTVLENITEVKLHRVPKNSIFIADLFNIIAGQNVDIEMISEIMLEDEVVLQLTCAQKSQRDLNDAMDKIRHKYEQIEIAQDRMVSKIVVEGNWLDHSPGAAAGLLNIFAQLQVPILQIATLLTGISFLIHKEDVQKVISEITKAYDFTVVYRH